MPQVMDGNEAVAYVSSAYTEVATIYPITPSSTMAEKVEDMAVRHQVKNVFGDSIRIVEMQSEAGVAGTMHGLLRTGALATSYTCSQGLLLMIPALYKMVGEQLPGVIHVSARAISTSGLSIFGDHSDVMAARQTGAMMLASSSVQEAALFAAIAHVLALQVGLPVLHFFDGFNTSHEQRKIVLPGFEDLAQLLDLSSVRRFRQGALRNDAPKAYGSAMTPDLYFQQLEASNLTYQGIEEALEELLAVYNPLFGASSSVVDYFGSPSAKTVMVAMGSVTATIRQVVSELSAAGAEVGVLVPHLYRPFPLTAFLEKMPATVESVVVLDRTKEAGSVAEPLLADVQSACYDCSNRPQVIGGRYGLGSKDTTPADIRAAFQEGMLASKKRRFTIGIEDDVTHLSLPPIGKRDLTNLSTTYQTLCWGFGSDGAVSGNKQTVQIIGDLSDLDVQGQFWFDSRKTGNVTLSQLRFSQEDILSSYQVQSADFISCYHDRYLRNHDVIGRLKDGGIFLLNTSYQAQQLMNYLPNRLKRQLAEKRSRFFILPASRLARAHQLGPKINEMMQLCFFHLSRLVPFEEAYELLKTAVRKKYGDIGQDLVEDNLSAMEAALSALKEVPVLEEWQFLSDEDEPVLKQPIGRTRDIKQLLAMSNTDLGDTIKVSDFVNHQMQDGSRPVGTSQYEKRFSCTKIPDWNSEECLQCNLCATVCPHAAIRPFLFEDGNDSGLETVAAKGKKGLQYRLQVSPYDCTGCQLCYDICPSKKKALQMKPVTDDVAAVHKEWEKSLEHQVLPRQEDVAKQPMREIQLKQPLLEFSSACAGCGETAYIKLLTQLYGDSMLIANATGCSSIWGCSSFTVPYTTNENGYGPTWATSLLENNAEYGYGMQIGSTVLQENLSERVRAIAENTCYSQELRRAASDWYQAFQENTHYHAISQLLINALINEKEAYPELQECYDLRFLLAKRSQWIIGGDGWAYDIGYGGLDHVISQRQNVNILILDNEGYANTGGQTSKATPLGSRSRFSSIGNQGRKKDLASLLIQNESVYVAQIALSANPEQALKAIVEAERYDGPSVLIAYSPCILHGISQNSAVIESQKAVDCGYWHLFRFQPETPSHGARFKLDSRKPHWEHYQDYLLGERRYSSLNQIDDDYSRHMLQQTQRESEKRYHRYQNLSQYYKGDSKHD